MPSKYWCPITPSEPLWSQQRSLGVTLAILPCSEICSFVPTIHSLSAWPLTVTLQGFWCRVEPKALGMCRRAHEPLPFTSSIFTPWFFPVSSSWGNPSSQSLQKSLTNIEFLPTPHYYPQLFYSVFFSSSEAGLYVHIFDLRGIIAATRVNNAVVNYKSEYLKMKPALSHSLLPNGNACDLWPPDKGILMEKRCS